VAGNRTLVVENDATDDVRRLGDWLVEGGLALEVARPHAGDALPETLDGYAALVVLGGEQHAGDPGTAWFPALESLLRKAVRYETPTLGVCLGAQVLAVAHAGSVARSASGPEIGPRLVARRDAAERDALWAPVPLAPDVLQWHHDEITELPTGATLLAASTYHPHQAFRLGTKAWGVQFHIECDTDMVATWASRNGALLSDLGYDPDELVAACDAVMPDLEEVWRPFAHRFAAIALGTLSTGSGRELPILRSP
jgi:GMP synthase-like glutamine amidotransferase